MTTAAAAVAATGQRRSVRAWGLSVFTWCLPVHILVITLLFGAFTWPATTVRVIAAWKELLIGVLFAIAVTQAVIGGGVPRRVQWLDLAVCTLGVLALGYPMGGEPWVWAGLALGAEPDGPRGAAFGRPPYFRRRA